MEMPCPSFNFILDLPSSMQPFLLNSAAGVSMQFTQLLLLLTSRFSLLNALEWDCKLSMSDHVSMRHSGSWPCSWFRVSHAAGLHRSQAISGRFCCIFPSHTQVCHIHTHTGVGQSSHACNVVCSRLHGGQGHDSWLTDSYSHPHLACNKLSRAGLRGSTCPLWEHSSYKQHLFGGWCLAAGHDPISLAGTDLMQFPRDPSGRKASFAFGAAVFVLSFLKTNTILLIKSHALRMLDSECTTTRCMLATKLAILVRLRNTSAYVYTDMSWPGMSNI